ncbi:transposase, mutator-like family protein [Bifidobacterium saguini DSM 23967]|uniref:Transposase, mutator-like family protein n=1 Tax=Bifidobacterium saguini DSM 23967 TaxID=1437607 RepID=A0A087D7Q1_9BIFI|nr:transposase, mutator-like family protein [Bifidobacterium saguini DSM 23967]
MSQQILQVDQAMLETTLNRMVRKTVEETLNAMLDAEADEITGAARYDARRIVSAITSVI